MTNTSVEGWGLRSALAEAERVAKKQRTCAESTSAALDRAVATLAAAADAARDTAAPPTAAMLGAVDALRGPDITGRVEAVTKDFHGAIGKLGKVRETMAASLQHW
jgi:hypothetical protein